MKNKLFIIIILSIILAFISQMIEKRDEATFSRLLEYEYALSHGILPQGSYLRCNELHGMQSLNVTFDGKMYVITPIVGQPAGISIGCQVLSGSGIEIDIN